MSIDQVPIFGTLEDINLDCNGNCHIELVISKDEQKILEVLVLILREEFKGKDVRILISELLRRVDAK